MEVKGQLEAVNGMGGRTIFALSTGAENAAAELEKLKGKELKIKVVQYRKGRSLSANALFWHCVDEIAKALRRDRWSVYLSLLRDYGKSTYICVKPSMVDAVKKQWRGSMELGTLEIRGQKAIQMQVFFGSSTYDTAEMSRLIDGTIDEMRELGLDPPMPQDIQTALEQWWKEERMEQSEK